MVEIIEKFIFGDDFVVAVLSLPATTTTSAMPSTTTSVLPATTTSVLDSSSTSTAAASTTTTLSTITTTTSTTRPADTCTDSDGDGFAVEGGLCGDRDCDDNDTSTHPGAPECPEGHADGKDNNCDGQADEGCPSDGCALTFVLGADDPDLETLRRIRDEILASSDSGRFIIDAFYRNDERILAYLDNHPAAESLVRNLVRWLAPALRVLLE